MNYEDSIHTQDLLDLIQLIDAWEIPEKDFAQVVNEQARLMFGVELEPSSCFATDLPFASLRF